MASSPTFATGAISRTLPCWDVVAAVFVIVSSLASASLRQKVTPVKRPRAADGSELKTIAEMMSIK